MMLFIKAKPDSFWLLWKLHRFIMKKCGAPMEILLPSGHMLSIKYFAEGKYNYLFRVKRDARLLKITRAQFYDLEHEVDRDVTIENCRLMNNLAAANLSPHCEYLCGGAYFVEHAGKLISCNNLPNRKLVTHVFADIERWTLLTKTVILDYNKNNWCMMRDHIWLVDIDVNYTCPLNEIRNNVLVKKRVNVADHKTDVSILVALLKREEELLWANLTGAEK